MFNLWCWLCKTLQAFHLVYNSLGYWQKVIFMLLWPRSSSLVSCKPFILLFQNDKETENGRSLWEKQHGQLEHILGRIWRWVTAQQISLTSTLHSSKHPRLSKWRKWKLCRWKWSQGSGLQLWKWNVQLWPVSLHTKVKSSSWIPPILLYVW